jgi:CcmD family protein
MLFELLQYSSTLWQGGVDPNLTLNYLLLGYVAMWVIALLYVLSLHSRQRNMQQDIMLLKQLLEDSDKGERQV